MANWISKQQTAAGTSATHIERGSDTCSDTDDKNPMYSRGQQYGCDVKPNLKTHCPRHAIHNTHTRTKIVQLSLSQFCQPRTCCLSSGWMRGVRWCFVYGQSHRSNGIHVQEEATAAINKLESKQPMAPVTVSDRTCILDLCVPAD